MTSDTMKVDWAQPLEVVYDNGDVFTPDESHGNYASWVDGDGDRRRHCFEDDGRSNMGDCFRIRNKPAAAVAPVGTDEEWGTAIEVGGVRPAWLEDGVPTMVHWNDGERFAYDSDCIRGWGSSIRAIQVKANHPHYRTEKPAEAPLGVSTGVERLERYEGFLRRLAGGFVGSAEAVDEAKALLPVDPDLLKAREIACQVYEGQTAPDFTKGENDSDLPMKLVVAGIKAGREMGK